MARYTKKQKLPETNEPPIIILPEDEAHKQQLHRKLEEYRQRIDPFRHPGLQMSAVCKKTVLEHLLRDGQVNTWKLSKDMAATHGQTFDIDAFNNACAVIDDYCKTGGKKAQGGTGFAQS